MTALMEANEIKDATLLDRVHKALDFPIVEVPKLYGTFEAEDGTHTFSMPGRKAIYRPDIKQVVNVVTTGYTTLQHKDAVNMVLEALDKRDIKVEVSKFHLHPTGRYMFLHLKTEEAFTIDEKTGDTVQLENIVTNSLDFSANYGLEMGGTRLICLNGMRGYRKDFGVASKHFHMDAQKIVDGFFQLVDRFRNDFMPLFKAAHEEGVSQAEALQLVEALDVAAKYKKAMTGMLYNGTDFTEQNLWSVYNIMTAVATHAVKSYMVRRHMEMAAFQMVRDRLN